MWPDLLWALYGIGRAYPLALVAITVFGTVLVAFGIVAPRVIRRRTPVAECGDLSPTVFGRQRRCTVPAGHDPHTVMHEADGWAWGPAGGGDCA